MPPEQRVGINVENVLDILTGVAVEQLLHELATHGVQVNAQAHVVVHDEAKRAVVVGWVRLETRDADGILQAAHYHRDVDGVWCRHRSP